MSRRTSWLVVPALLTAWGMGCEVEAPPPPSRIGGAQFITFRCAPRPATELPATGFPELGRAGAPLDGCGCTQYLDGVPGYLDAASCALGNAEIRAYVAGNAVGEVAAVRLNRALRTTEGRILDSDETVPGVTGIYVDDIISDIEADPEGRFVMSVNATSGTLAVIVDDFAIEPDLVIAPDVGPLATIAVWPPIEWPRDEARTLAGGGRRAWVSAPTARQVLQIDLDAIQRLLDGEAADPVTAVFEMPDEAAPAEIAVHPAGDRIYVGHAAEPAITAFSVTTGEIVGRIDLSRQVDCDDGYLTGVVARIDDESCADGLDNDGDMVLDADDPDCAGPFGSEWPNPACPQRAECADGVDNNGDGLVDGDDPTCADGTGRWEGEPPVCANGEDDDGDGLVDRDDHGCATEAGVDELPVGDGLESGDLCLDGEDNDGDGLIDIAEDPGCADPENAAGRYLEERITACADGLDNDGDGLIDFVGGDTDCYAASDDAEGAARVELGPRELTTVRFAIDGRTYDYLYTTEAVGYLVAIDLDDPDLRARYTGIDRTVTSSAVRQRGDANALLVMASDGALRSMQITTPAPLRTADGRDVFARFSDLYGAFDDASRERPDLYDRSRFRHAGVGVEAFYAVEDGVAGRIAALDGVCPDPLPDEGGGCGAGRSLLLGLCAPDTCEGASECPGGFACLDGACARRCSAHAQCGRFERCDVTTPSDAAPQRVCRSRCRIDDRELVDVAPPRAPCDLAKCGAACAADTDCGAGLACIEGACQSWCTAESCEAPFDPQTAPVVEPSSIQRLSGDPLAQRAGRAWVVNDEVNVLRFARSRTPRMTAAPRTLVRSTPISVNLGRFPGFCRIPQADETAAFPGWPDGACAPLGTTLTEDQRAQATRFRVDLFPHVQVLENRPGRLPSQDFSVAYEAVLPRSESLTGRHAGLTEVTLDADVSSTGAEATVPGWILVDYEQDFCSAGVEVGDVLLIDRMTPVTVNESEEDALAALCEPFLRVDTAQPPERRRDRLRYRVAEVSPFKLVLRPDGTAVTDTRSYGGMLRRDDRLVAPDLAPALDPPPPDCMAQLTSYRVRVGESFLLIGSRTGYRHPWVRRGAECVEDPQRLERHSRVKLGVPFENEWFRFQLGPNDPALLADDPEDGPTQPYLVDVALQFSVDGGALVRRLAGWSFMPQGMRWLPNSDLLYIVDGALQTLVEIGGLDVLREEFTISEATYD